MKLSFDPSFGGSQSKMRGQQHWFSHLLRLEDKNDSVCRGRTHGKSESKARQRGRTQLSFYNQLSGKKIQEFFLKAHLQGSTKPLTRCTPPTPPIGDLKSYTRSRDRSCSNFHKASYLLMCNIECRRHHR